MKTTALLLFIAATYLTGCAHVSPNYQTAEAQVRTVPDADLPPAPPVQRLTAEQAIALAKPYLPLPPGDSYRARFIPDASKVYAPGNGQNRTDAIWWVYTDRDGANYRTWTIAVIRDSDGKFFGVEIHA